jgi:methyl-accepting chemotaxis protein
MRQSKTRVRIIDKAIPSGAKLRWNSIFIKLGALVAACAMVMAVLIAVTYSRSSLQLIETEVAASGGRINGLLANVLGGAVLSRAPGPIEREFDKLVSAETAGTRYAVAIDDNGQVLGARGAIAADELALVALARDAMAQGIPITGSGGMMIANPVINAMTGAAVGALATSWTADFAAAEAMRAQRAVMARVLAVIVLTATVMMIVFRSWVSRPMLALTRAVDHMAQDDLDIEIAEAARGDELGDIGQALTTLRDCLVAGRNEARENRFRGTAFASSSAAIMMVDAERRITSTNKTLQDILRHYVEDFRQVSAGFEPDDIVGRTMDDFHAPALRERVNALMADPANFPYSADLSIGDARFRLTINRVAGADGALEGFVVEWNDVTSEYMNTAVLSAIDANQVKAEFGLDGTLLHANAHFTTCLAGPSDTLIGRRANDLFRFDPAMDRERGDVFDRLREGQSVYGSFVVRRGDGEDGVLDGGFTPVYDTCGRLLRIVLIATDRTEAKRLLDLAEADRARLQSAQAGMVDTLRKSLETLAGGDLTGRITEAFPDEYEQLRKDFNTAVDQLQQAMRGVIDNAGLIRGEASEISSAADDLSARTERQAATLEQTAAALDELTSSVKSAADGAAHSNTLVKTAWDNAEASGAVVREAVEAMGEIEASSQQISKITGVIDDIAFQTNLLALNAGVEAARAGEAGRGFAVVASEVRALAQRSSDAAREINALISASGGQVKRGVDLVDQAGAALKGIVDSVKEISRNVSEIAVSSREQSAGLAEINVAMNQLDQVTQQNAAMFEQTTAASHALTREAETLTVTMGRFQTGRAPDENANVVKAEFSSRRAVDPAASAPSRAGTAAVAAAVATDLADDGWDEF